MIKTENLENIDVYWGILVKTLAIVDSVQLPKIYIFFMMVPLKL